jgi:hypothetical protein
LYRLPLDAVVPDADAGADGGPEAGGPSPEKISTVSGRYEMTMSNRVDDGFVYWMASGSIFRFSPTAGPALEVVPLDDPPRDVLHVYGGTIFWAASSAFGGSHVYKRAVENGMTEVVASVDARSLAADDQYLYAASGKDILRFHR